MDYLALITSIFAVASIFGTIAAGFYGVRQKTIITTLRESNDAYKERNEQLDTQVQTMTKDHQAKLNELEGRIKSLEAIKTPPFKPMMELITKNHAEVMAAITGESV